MNKHQTTLFVMVAGLMLLSLGLILAQPTPLQAQGDPFPTATPLGTPPPTAVPTPLPVGGTLILQVYHAPANSWSVVQWQDANGGWHDVSGWQSQLTHGYVGWWVAPEDYGTGPFRWLLLDGAGGQQLGASESFHLPGYTKSVTLIELALD